MAKQRTITDIDPALAVDFLLPPIQQKTPRPKRKLTQWEKEHPTTTFYLPDRLAESVQQIRREINAIAAAELIHPSPCSEKLLDYAITRHARGDVPITARPHPAARKLVVQWVETRNWPRQIEINQQPIAKRAKRQYPSISYRWNVNLRKAVLRIAEQHATLPGETALALLAYGIQQYKNGSLSLTKTPAVVHQVEGWKEAQT